MLYLGEITLGFVLQPKLKNQSQNHKSNVQIIQRWQIMVSTLLVVNIEFLDGEYSWVLNPFCFVETNKVLKENDSIGEVSSGNIHYDISCWFCIKCA